MGFGGWRQAGGGAGGTEAVLPALNQIEAYWTALAAACPDIPVPARAALDPRGIESALSHTFLIEQLAPGVARLRLGGLELARLLGSEVRGMPLSVLFLSAARARLAEAVQSALLRPARVVLAVQVERGLIRAPLAGRMLLLPLRDSHGGITRALGGLQMHEPLGPEPRRLAITGIAVTPLAMPAGWRPPEPGRPGDRAETGASVPPPLPARARVAAPRFTPHFLGQGGGPAAPRHPEPAPRPVPPGAGPLPLVLAAARPGGLSEPPAAPFRAAALAGAAPGRVRLRVIQGGAIRGGAIRGLAE